MLLRLRIIDATIGWYCVCIVFAPLYSRRPGPAVPAYFFFFPHGQLDEMTSVLQHLGICLGFPRSGWARCGFSAIEDGLHFNQCAACD